MPFIDPNEIIIRERFRKELEVDEMVRLIESFGGQTNPIIVEKLDGKYYLLDGERRTRACAKLGRQVWYTTDKEGQIKVEDDLDRRRIELMANLGKPFTTREKAAIVEEIDRLMKDKFGQRKAGKPSPFVADTDKQGWSYAETAKLLGMKSPTSVADAVLISKASETNPEIAKAATMAEAKRILLRKAQEEARAELIRRGESLLAIEDDSFDPRKFYEEKVINDDCLIRLSKLPNGIVDYFVTDPPFGLKMHDTPTKNVNLTRRSLGAYKDEEAEVFALLANVIDEIARVGKPNCWVYMMCSSLGFYLLREMFIGVGFEVYQKPLIWVKTTDSGAMVPGVCQSMEFWPGSCYESILMARRGANQLYLQGQRDVLSHPVVPPQKKRHFVERPVSLMEELISRIHHPGTTAVLCDPFVGSGSTLVAAFRRHGIQAFGFEINKEYRDKAVDYLVEDYLVRHATGKVEEAL